MATPVLAELKAAGRRPRRAACTAAAAARSRTAAAGVEAAGARPDRAHRPAGAGRPSGSTSSPAGWRRAWRSNAAAHERDLVRVSARLSPAAAAAAAGGAAPAAGRRRRAAAAGRRCAAWSGRRERLAALAKLYASVDPERPLQRGFARVTRADGSIVHAGAALASGEAVAIKFGDQVTRQAVIEGAPAPSPRRPRRARQARSRNRRLRRRATCSEARCCGALNRRHERPRPRLHRRRPRQAALRRRRLRRAEARPLCGLRGDRQEGPAGAAALLERRRCRRPTPAPPRPCSAGKRPNAPRPRCL